MTQHKKPHYPEHGAINAEPLHIFSYETEQETMNYGLQAATADHCIRCQQSSGHYSQDSAGKQPLPQNISVHCHCTIMSQNPDGGGWFVISEVIKAGSLGHGTAVQGHFDLDLVVYSESKAAFTREF